MLFVGLGFFFGPPGNFFADAFEQILQRCNCISCCVKMLQNNC